MLARGAVGHQLGIEAGFAQALAQVPAGFRLVFDNQQFHGWLMCMACRRYTVWGGAAVQADKVVIFSSADCQWWLSRVSHSLIIV
ncbi:hypothetical protein D3C75_1139600 [compost metagenome]